MAGGSRRSCREEEEELELSSLCLLPDDVLTEIFIRLPHAAALVRCALTSKRHLRLISAAGFLRSFGILHPSSPLLGLFVYYRIERRYVSFRRSMTLPEGTDFIPLLQEDIIHCRRRTANSAGIYDSHSALLLVRSLHGGGSVLHVVDPFNTASCSSSVPLPPHDLLYDDMGGLYHADAGHSCWVVDAVEDTEDAG